MADSHVVVYSSDGKIKLGSLLTPMISRVMEQKGVITLPVESERMTVNGAGGYVLKHYGSGWSIDYTSPRMMCPIVLAIAPGDSKLVWRAGLVKPPGVQVVGSVRLASDTSQINTSAIALGPNQAFNLDNFEQSSQRCVIGGECNISATSECYCGLALYAKGNNCGIEWFAVSQVNR